MDLGICVRCDRYAPLEGCDCGLSPTVEELWETDEGERYRIRYPSAQDPVATGVHGGASRRDDRLIGWRQLDQLPPGRSMSLYRCVCCDSTLIGRAPECAGHAAPIAREPTPEHVIARGLPLGRAARAWAAGASVAGAMVPLEFGRFTHDRMDLAVALWHAALRADWASARDADSAESWIRPRRAVLDDEGLHWVTSVTLSLVQLADGWAITLSAPHDTREPAVLASLRPRPADSRDRW